MRKFYCFLIALGTSLLWNACSNSSAVNDDEPFVFGSSEIEGFAVIKSLGKSTVLGTNSANDGTLKERPQMKVAFDYDFYIGRHEVTCGEFNGMMKKSNAKLQINCDSDKLPVTDVTYYDAVLYANMMSKAKGLDTVYVYTSLKKDDEGHCISMDGFAFNLGVLGYRLPTEAEWVYVAALNWKPSESWNAGNSDFKAHEVCSKFGGEVCDMAGNVKEWVNDWMGYFRDTTVTDYIGARDGGSKDERVLKGGSFNDEVSKITLHGKGDTYTVTSVRKASYVGFRLALGAIENPVDASGSAVSKTRLVATAEQIQYLVGSRYTKLAFRNDVTGNINFVDFNQQNLNVVEIRDSLENAYHPDISPDGSKVAFCTEFEGHSGKSEVYVSNLDAEGSGLVKLDVESAAIPRWRVLASGDTVIVYVTDAGDNKNETSFSSQSTWQVPFAKGKFGKPELLFSGAYHDGVSADGKLAVTGASLLRARIDDAAGIRDTVWYNGSQACNASLANDGSKRTLFLDFGKKDGKKFVYYQHERLLIADSVGNLIQSLASPKGYSFNHTEWALNGKNLVVAALNNSNNNANEKIAIVDTQDSSVTPVVVGDELWHPCLWTKFDESGKSSKWNADSVGRYASESNQANYLLSHKMPMLWKLKDSVELVGLGNSHMWAGFDPFAMSVPSMNLGVVPCDMHCVDYLFENYVLNHFSKVKYVVVGLDFDLWYNIDARTDVGECMGSAPGFVYDVDHDFHKKGVDEDFVNLVMANAVDAAPAVIEERGWFAASDNMGWTDQSGKSEIIGDSTWSECLVNDAFMTCLASSDLNTCLNQKKLSVCQSGKTLSGCLKNGDLNSCKGIFSADIDKLKDLIRVAQKHGITVVGLVFPISPYYKGTGSYGRHGMLRSHAKLIYDEIQKLAKSESNFVLMDENKFGEHDYPSSMANDYDHLNKDGAKRLSTRLDSLIKTLK